MQINTSTKKIQKKTFENLENCINTGKTLKKKRKKARLYKVVGKEPATLLNMNFFAGIS